MDEKVWGISKSDSKYHMYLYKITNVKSA